MRGIFVSFEPASNIYTVPVTLSSLSIQMIKSMKDTCSDGGVASNPWSPNMLCHCAMIVPVQCQGLVSGLAHYQDTGQLFSPESRDIKGISELPLIQLILPELV